MTLTVAEVLTKAAEVVASQRTVERAKRAQIDQLRLDAHVNRSDE